MREKGICDKIIKALQNKGLKAISLGTGTFDILYVDKSNKYNIIEVKTISEDNLKYTPKAKQNNGITFSEEQTQSLKELYPNTPTLIVELNGKFYLIDSMSLNALLSYEQIWHKRATILKNHLKHFELLDFKTMMQKLTQ
jgi:hypothetical protein